MGEEGELALAELERVQSRILDRISNLELSLSPPPTKSGAGDTAARLSAILRSNGVNDFTFKRVPPDYYDWPLESRRDALAAASVEYLCKSIVLVNTQAPAEISDCSNRNYSKYYVVVVQYVARFNAETVKNFLYTLNEGKIAKKRFNMRLAPEEISNELTGFEHNAVTCVGMKTDIPVILDEAIAKLQPDFFWLGGGEVDLKLVPGNTTDLPTFQFQRDILSGNTVAAFIRHPTFIPASVPYPFMHYSITQAACHRGKVGPLNVMHKFLLALLLSPARGIFSSYPDIFAEFHHFRCILRADSCDSTSIC